MSEYQEAYGAREIPRIEFYDAWVKNRDTKHANFADLTVDLNGECHRIECFGIKQSLAPISPVVALHNESSTTPVVIDSTGGSSAPIAIGEMAKEGTEVRKRKERDASAFSATFDSTHKPAIRHSNESTVFATDYASYLTNIKLTIFAAMTTAVTTTAVPTFYFLTIFLFVVLAHLLK
jgi:hypothetical protein